MPAWFLPALKAVLPYVSPIVSAALPVFTTRKNTHPTAPQGDLTQQQISELQDAVSHNAAHIKELAETLQQTVTALEQAAADAEKRSKSIIAVSWIAIALALAASVISLFALLKV